MHPSCVITESQHILNNRCNYKKRDSKLTFCVTLDASGLKRMDRRTRYHLENERADLNIFCIWLNVSIRFWFTCLCNRAWYDRFFLISQTFFSWRCWSQGCREVRILPPHRWSRLWCFLEFDLWTRSRSCGRPTPKPPRQGIGPDIRVSCLKKERNDLVRTRHAFFRKDI